LAVADIEWMERITLPRVDLVGARLEERALSVTEVIRGVSRTQAT